MGTTEYLEKEAFDERHNILYSGWSIVHAILASTQYTE